MAKNIKTGSAGEAAALPLVSRFTASSDGPAGVRLILGSRFGDSIAKLSPDGADRLAAYLESVSDPVLMLGNKPVGVPPEMAAQMAQRLRAAQHEEATATPRLFVGWRDENGLDPVANLRINSAESMRAAVFPRQVGVAA